LYKTILVPLDTSERAEKILPHVESLCGVKQGRVILLHVVDLSLFAASPAIPSGQAAAVTPQTYIEQLSTLREAGKEYLSKIQEILRTKGISVETVLETGSAAERIVRVAEEQQADLIALASHGRTGLSRVFFGSVAAAVLHRSERPLLLVRSRDDA